MRNKTNRENTRQRKQSHAQDNIYALALSHIKNKNRSWLPLSSLFSLMRLLTRLIGILYEHTTTFLISNLIYIYIYIYMSKSAVLGIIFLVEFGQLGLVAI